MNSPQSLDEFTTAWKDRLVNVKTPPSPPLALEQGVWVTPDEYYSVHMKLIEKIQNDRLFSSVRCVLFNRYSENGYKNPLYESLFYKALSYLVALKHTGQVDYNKVIEDVINIEISFIFNSESNTFAKYLTQEQINTIQDYAQMGWQIGSFVLGHKQNRPDLFPTDPKPQGQSLMHQPQPPQGQPPQQYQQPPQQYPQQQPQWQGQPPQQYQQPPQQYQQPPQQYQQQPPQQWQGQPPPPPPQQWQGQPPPPPPQQWQGQPPPPPPQQWQGPPPPQGQPPQYQQPLPQGQAMSQPSGQRSMINNGANSIDPKIDNVPTSLGAGGQPNVQQQTVQSQTFQPQPVQERYPDNTKETIVNTTNMENDYNVSSVNVPRILDDDLELFTPLIPCKSPNQGIIRGEYDGRILYSVAGRGTQMRYQDHEPNISWKGSSRYGTIELGPEREADLEPVTSPTLIITGDRDLAKELEDHTPIILDDIVDGYSHDHAHVLAVSAFVEEGIESLNDRIYEYMVNIRTPIVAQKKEVEVLRSLKNDGDVKLTDFQPQNLITKLNEISDKVSFDLWTLIEKRLTKRFNEIVQFGVGVDVEGDSFVEDCDDVMKVVENTVNDNALMHFVTRLKIYLIKAINIRVDASTHEVYLNEQHSVTRLPFTSSKLDLQVPMQNYSEFGALTKHANPDLYNAVDAIFERTNKKERSPNKRWLVTIDNTWIEVHLSTIGQNVYMIRIHE